MRKLTSSLSQPFTPALVLGLGFPGGGHADLGQVGGDRVESLSRLFERAPLQHKGAWRWATKFVSTVPDGLVYRHTPFLTPV
jgi:hypothetical protein